MRPREPWTSLREKIEHYLEKQQPDGCWVWPKGKTATGYGRVFWEGRMLAVHRAYLKELGHDVPDGMDVDHLCRVRACANPDHLEVVSHRENLMRSPVTQASVNARKTQCVQGHEYTEENTRITAGGWRGCKTCNRLSARRSNNARRNARIIPTM